MVDTEAGLFVVKFRGAGQGAKALVAELVVGTLARALSLPMPELAVVDVPEPFGRSEPDPEIQEVLRKSHGANVGLRYLDGAFNFDGAAAGELVDAELATRIVWFDAFVTNPDRTARNTNLMVWERTPWLIDHGAALYAQHDWPSVDETRARSAFAYIRDHVLLTAGGDPREVDAAMRAVLTDDVLEAAVQSVPDALLEDAAVRADFATPREARDRYLWYLRTRLSDPRAFVDEAAKAREDKLQAVPERRTARR